jgi:hypothetical protein
MTGIKNTQTLGMQAKANHLAVEQFYDLLRHLDLGLAWGMLTV